MMLLVSMLALSFLTNFTYEAEGHGASWCPIEVCTLLAGGTIKCYVVGYVSCHDPHGSAYTTS